MGLWKFLIIPLLIVAYIYSISSWVGSGFVTTSSGQTTPSGGGQPIGLGEAISVTVTRPYLFGLVRLPIYSNTLGNIAFVHDVFFLLMFMLFVAFTLIEWRKRT